MIHRDSDGSDVLDFFGARMREIHAEPQARAAATAAWRYVTAEESRQRVAGNDSVAAKYQWLVNYMRPRLPLWGVS
jgi:hypothetical protein